MVITLKTSSPCQDLPNAHYYYLEQRAQPPSTRRNEPRPVCSILYILVSYSFGLLQGYPEFYNYSVAEWSTSTSYSTPGNLRRPYGVLLYLRQNDVFCVQLWVTYIFICEVLRRATTVSVSRVDFVCEVVYSGIPPFSGDCFCFKGYRQKSIHHSLTPEFGSD